MIRGTLAYCLLAATLAVPQFAHAQDLPSGTMACLARLRQAPPAAAEKRGPRRLGDVCPGVAEALAAGPWGGALPRGEIQNLTARSLRQLVDLSGHYRRAPRVARDLSAAKLGGIVAGLAPFEPKPRLSLWDRIVAKLREWLGLDRGGGELAKWLQRFAIPALWRRLLVYTLVLALVAGVLAVLINELRHGGAFARRSRRHRGSRVGAAAEAGSHVRVASFDDVLGAPPGRQPVVLFALLVERLRARDAALVRESSTHRELVAAVRRQGLSFAAALGAVATAAEGVTFGDRPPDGTELETVLAEGATVLRELELEPEPAA